MIAQAPKKPPLADASLPFASLYAPQTHPPGAPNTHTYQRGESSNDLVATITTDAPDYKRAAEGSKIAWESKRPYDSIVPPDLGTMDPQGMSDTEVFMMKPTIGVQDYVNEAGRQGYLIGAEFKPPGVWDHSNNERPRSVAERRKSVDAELDIMSEKSDARIVSARESYAVQACQLQIINQTGAASGFEMCFAPSTFGAGGANQNTSRIQHKEV